MEEVMVKTKNILQILGIALVVSGLDVAEAMQRENPDAEKSPAEKRSRRRPSAIQLGSPEILTEPRRRQPVQRLIEVRRALLQEENQRKVPPTRRASKRPAAPSVAPADYSDADSIRSLQASVADSESLLSSWDGEGAEEGRAAVSPPRKRQHTEVMDARVTMASAHRLERADKVTLCQSLMVEVGGEVNLSTIQVLTQMRRLRKQQRDAILAEWQMPVPARQAPPQAPPSNTQYQVPAVQDLRSSWNAPYVSNPMLPLGTPLALQPRGFGAPPSSYGPPPPPPPSGMMVSWTPAPLYPSVGVLSPAPNPNTF